MMERIRRLASILSEPVLAETRANLARSRARVPDHLQGPRQMLGRGGNGCGATIGAMPRCDFACRGCYLGEEANRIPAEPVEAIKAQIRRLRPTLGNGGNLQLTDGEVLLRPVEEVIELLRYAQRLDLIPMLMTHGDGFRRRPGLLEQLVVEGGLVEVSIHIDTTQRGRVGDAYRYATSEAGLNPLRDEFATMIRRVAQETGRPLRAATTMTVTADSVAGVPAVVRWLKRNADAFRLISFQPLAQVGRTESVLQGVSVETLWEHIAEGLYDGPEASERANRGQLWIGHPDCNRYMPGLVLTVPGREPLFEALRYTGDPTDERIVDSFLDRFGGITFRLDGPLERATRWAALAARAPGFVFGGAMRCAAHWLRRFDPEHPCRLLARLATGRARIGGLVIISHHFMSRAEAESPRGQERRDLCVFHVPVGDQLIPMCQANALGVREEYYAELRDRARSSVAALAGKAPG
ncbi:MAG: radical SAM protein [Gemmatimonadales bacterium]